MAETLTVDTTPQTETMSDNLTRQICQTTLSQNLFRQLWPTTEVFSGCQVEIVRAVQGG